MGKRSRKRLSPDAPAQTRAERDARRAAAPRRTRTRTVTRERPPAPWGSFPLSEIVVLLALICGVIGFLNLDSDRGKVAVGAAMVLGSLAGLEVSIREHFAGYRSHTLLLGGGVGIVVTAVLFALGWLPPLATVLVGLATAGGAAWGFLNAFRRRSGGALFRVR
jgi:hypothetical protein